MSFPVRRLRRLRIDKRVRDLVRENVILPERLILPLFVAEGIREPQAIQTMPGNFRWPADLIVRPIEEALTAGIKNFLFFGVPVKKDAKGSSAMDSSGVVPKALSLVKKTFPEAFLVTDVCLCAYTNHGHCGMIDNQGNVLNDETLPLLAEMAICHARAGADLIAPSDMMDGRIGAIRKSLDQENFHHLPIMSYAAKYSSSFYGPFREAANSAPKEGNRKSYQMDPANRREAILEMEADIEEGADILMVKPALPFLDVISEARRNFNCPLAAYQVSGEFAMIKAAAANGWLDERAAVLESLTAIFRAGADMVLSYYAVQAAQWLKESR